MSRRIIFIIAILGFFHIMFNTEKGSQWGVLFFIIPALFANQSLHLISTISSFFARNIIIKFCRLFFLVLGSILCILFLYVPIVNNNFLIFYIPICLLFCLIDFLELSDLKKTTTTKQRIRFRPFIFAVPNFCCKFLVFLSNLSDLQK